MNRRALASIVPVLVVSLNLAACGSGGETTVTGEAGSAESAKVEALKLEKEKAELEAERANAEAQKEARAARRAAAKARSVESEPESEPETAQVPKVVGLPLPAAQQILKEAGYKAAPKNTDTTFGIVVPSHYTICTQGRPRGKFVPVLAQKYGC